MLHGASGRLTNPRVTPTGDAARLALDQDKSVSLFSDKVRLPRFAVPWFERPVQTRLNFGIAVIMRKAGQLLSTARLADADYL